MSRRTVEYRVQYCAKGRDITGDLYAEQDATQVRFWDGADGDTVILAVIRSPRDCWQIETSDGHLSHTAYRLRFRRPKEALRYLGNCWRVDFTEVY